MSGPTIVVKFGDSVASGALCLVELDEKMNVDGEGKAKSQFYPGDPVYFLVHHDPTLQITAIGCTSGQVVAQGTVSRDHKEDVFFLAPDEAHETPHNVAGGVTGKWYGRASALTMTGRSLLAPGAPCIGSISYSFTARLFQFLPPAMTLAVDETWPVGIVITVEAI
jgi:hypothetical protein